MRGLSIRVNFAEVVLLQSVEHYAAQPLNGTPPGRMCSEGYESIVAALEVLCLH